MQSRRFATIVTIVIVFAFVVAFVAPAFASGSATAFPVHARLTSASPADGATVESADEVVLTFNENVNPDFVAVKVTGPDGSETDGDPDVDGRVVTQALAADLPAGTHEVAYRVVSADGHPIAGTLSFSTTASPASATSTPTTTTLPTPTATTSSAVASPTPTATTAPVSGDSDEGLPWLLVVGVGVAVAAALAALWRGIRRPRAGGDDGRTPPV
jgi:hypothetical protein